MKYLFLLLFFTSFFELDRKAFAKGESPTVSGKGYSAQIISSLSRFDKEPILGAIYFRLDEGYRVSWRFPGEIGTPPEIDWSGSKNLEKVEINWPAPKRFDSFGINSFGYDSNVLIPVTFYPNTSFYALELELVSEFFICSDVCSREKINIDFDIPGGFEEKGPMAGVLDYIYKTLPNKGDTQTLKIENVVLGPDAIVAIVYSEDGFENLDLFAESNKVSFVALPEVVIDKNNSNKANIKIKAPLNIDNLVKALTGSKVVLTLVINDKAIEKEFSF